MNNKETLEGLEKLFKNFSGQDEEIIEDYFESKCLSEDLDKKILEGLTHLSNYNPLGRVIIDIKEKWDSENHPHAEFNIKMINLL